MIQDAARDRQKAVDEQGNILDLVIWQVPTTPRSASGLRYRLAFVGRGKAEPAVLYDNHSPKGHHRHVEGVEQPYAFVDVDQLLEDFMADGRRITRNNRWPRH